MSRAKGVYDPQDNPLLEEAQASGLLLIRVGAKRYRVVQRTFPVSVSYHNEVRVGDFAVEEATLVSPPLGYARAVAFLASLVEAYRADATTEGG